MSQLRLKDKCKVVLVFDRQVFIFSINSWEWNYGLYGVGLTTENCQTVSKVVPFYNPVSNAWEFQSSKSYYLVVLIFLISAILVLEVDFFVIKKNLF